MDNLNPVEFEQQQQATYSRYHRLLTVFERLLALNAVEAANKSGRCTDAKLTDIKSVALGVWEIHMAALVNGQEQDVWCFVQAVPEVENKFEVDEIVVV